MATTPRRGAGGFVGGRRRRIVNRWIGRPAVGGCWKGAEHPRSTARCVRNILSERRDDDEDGPPVWWRPLLDLSMGCQWVRRQVGGGVGSASAEAGQQYTSSIEGVGCITLIRRRRGSNRNDFIDTLFSMRKYFVSSEKHKMKS